MAKSTIRRDWREVRPPRRGGQPWATFPRNHAPDIRARDFPPVTDLFFRPLFAFFVVELASRRVVHVGATRHPTDDWVAQQPREATPFDPRPRYLIRARDSKYGPTLARVAAATGIAVMRAAYRAPWQNATRERFPVGPRRECLDHLLVLGEAHLRRILHEHVRHFDHDRPHQGLARRIPGAAAVVIPRGEQRGQVRTIPVLGGLHHASTRAA